MGVNFDERSPKVSPAILQNLATPLPPLPEEDVGFRADQEDSYILAQATIRHKHSVDEDILIDAGRAVKKGAIHGAKAAKKGAKDIGKWWRKKQREKELAEQKRRAEEQREARKAEREAKRIEVEQRRGEREAARAEQRRMVGEQRRLEEEQRQAELEQVARQKQAEDKDTACELYNAATDFLRDEEYQKAYEQITKIGQGKLVQAGLNSCFTAKEIVLTGGTIAKGVGNNKQAATLYNFYLKSNPTDTEIRSKLAATYFRMGQIKRAEREAKRALEEDMPNAEAEVVLGIINNNLEQLESAFGEEISPDFRQKALDLLVTGHFRLAEKGDFPEEREKHRVEGQGWLRRMLYDTGDRAPLLKLAERSEKLEEYAVAAEAYREASCDQPEEEDQPEDPTLIAKAAEAYFRAGNFIQSAIWYEQALALDKTNKRYEQQLALAREQMDQQTPIRQAGEKQPLFDKEGRNLFKLCGAVFNFDNGHFYHYYGDSIQTFEEGRNKCKEWGGHLVTISDKDENHFVLSLVYDDPFLRSESAILLGLAYYASDDKEGTWAWEGGEALTYTAWAHGEPNNVPTERYGTMIPRDRGRHFREGKWDSVALPFRGSESATLSYMCERE